MCFNYLSKLDGVKCVREEVWHDQCEIIFFYKNSIKTYQEYVPQEVIDEASNLWETISEIECIDESQRTPEEIELLIKHQDCTSAFDGVIKKYLNNLVSQWDLE